MGFPPHSACLGGQTQTHKADLLVLFSKGHKYDVDRNQFLVVLTHESAGDVFRHLVTRATHL